MKTYTKKIDAPQLVISHDESAESPREWDNVGVFLTQERRYNSPDGTQHPLYRIMTETADEATSTMHHIQLIRKAARREYKSTKDENVHVIAVHPVYRYEHGNVAYRRGTAGGFDSSNCGFYFVTAASIEGETHTAESLAKIIDGELKDYTQYANGEVYAFTLYDEQGRLVDSCGGLYSLEEIREHLPEDWKYEDLEDYMQR